MCMDSRQKQQMNVLVLMFLLLDCHILYHLKQELVLFYIAEKDSSGNTLIFSPLLQGLCECKDVRIVHLISAVPKRKSRIKSLRRIEDLQC